MIVTEIKIDVDFIEKVEETINKYVSKIPQFIVGIDRVFYLSELLKSMPYEDQFLLKDFVNYLLKIMISKEASDLEFGGFGSEGYVWYRVYGLKTREEKLLKLSFDQSAL